MKRQIGWLRSIESLAEIEMSEQKCPVCDGTGLVSKPPWIAGDQHEWSSTSSGPWPCNRCSGVGTFPTRRLKDDD